MEKGEKKIETYLPRIELDNTVISLYVNQKSRKIHVLDLDEYGKKTVTNAISCTYQLHVLEALATSQEVPLHVYREAIDYDWYLYHTDGYVSYWKDGSFLPIPFLIPMLFLPFVEIATQRRSLCDI